jgi:hypothetical protein
VAELDIAAFLRARYDEREARAKAADVKQGDTSWFVSPVVATAPRNFTVRSAQDKRPIARAADLAGDDAADTVGILDGEAVAAHIADNDPEFVLAGIKAKQQIVDMWARWADGFGTFGRAGEAMESTLRLLAQPYAGHPEFREEWKL